VSAPFNGVSLAKSVSLDIAQPAVMPSVPLKTINMQTTNTSVVIDIALQGEVRTADARFSHELLALLPTLAEHACASGGVGRFGEKLEGALLPHVVEHVAIDLLVREQDGATPVQGFAGNTVWFDRDRGIMRVRVSFIDSLVTQAALYKAIDLVNGLVTQTNR